MTGVKMFASSKGEAAHMAGDALGLAECSAAAEGPRETYAWWPRPHVYTSHSSEQRHM